jgi:hypothetical protein
VIACARRLPSALVGHGEGHKRKLLAVGLNFILAGAQKEFRRRAGGFDNVGGPLAAVFISDNFEFARLINHIVPMEAIFELALFLAAK